MPELQSTMNPTEWRQFLKQYSREFLKADWDVATTLFASRGAVIPEQARRTSWMGFEPATESAIASAEERLGRRLPPSLRSFYKVSNGWGMIGAHIFDILPVEKISWLKDCTDRSNVCLYKAACDIESPPLTGKPRRPWKDDPDGSRRRAFQYEQGTRLKRSLVISSWGDAAVWVLDPGEGLNDAEWPGGPWASWHPGSVEWIATSFADLMQKSLTIIIDRQEETP